MKGKLEFDEIKGISKEQIELISQKINIVIPENLKTFLELYSGGHSHNRTKIYSYDLTHEDGWESGDTIESIPTYSQVIEFHTNLKPYLKDTVEHFELTTNFVEIDFLLPFISLGSGGTINIAVGGKHNGKI